MSVWAGPYEGGMSQSLISRWLCDKETFRLRYIEGLAPQDRFHASREYGNAFHCAEEATANGCNPFDTISAYHGILNTRYQDSRSEIAKWMSICKTQYSIYCDYWRVNDSWHHYTEPLSAKVWAEKVFDVAYTLPDGRVVKLRGKRDRVDLVNGSFQLQENKTKSDVNVALITSQLESGFEFQTGFYLTALGADPDFQDYEIGGVRYNVIRKPLSAFGKHAIRPKKKTKKQPAETATAFYARLGDCIRGDPTYFFHRWEMPITEVEIARFRQECLDPILMSICDWWNNLQDAEIRKIDRFSSTHWRSPYNVWDEIDIFGTTPYDNYLRTGSRIGLELNDQLFPELQ